MSNDERTDLPTLGTFPQPELAQSYLRRFDLADVPARGLFARRRMGKSEFLKHDLLPAAMHDGYLAACTNLWDPHLDHPGQALATAILLATQPKGLGKFWDGPKRPRFANSKAATRSCRWALKILSSWTSAEKEKAASPRNPSRIAVR